MSSIIDKLKIVSHRAGKVKHENSLEAIAHSIESEIEWLEVDVRLTKDGEPIIMHDMTLGRTTNGSGFVHRKTFKEIRDLKLNNGGVVPTLQEVIDLTRGKVRLWLHIKLCFGPVAQKVWQVIKRNNMEEEVIISSVSGAHIYYLRSQSEKIWLNILSIFPYFKIRKAGLLKANSIQPKYRLTKKFVEAAQKQKMKVLTWPLTNKLQAKSYIHKGVDLIMSGEEEVLDFLKSVKRDGFKAVDHVIEPFWKRNSLMIASLSIVIGVYFILIRQ